MRARTSAREARAMTAVSAAKRRKAEARGHYATRALWREGLRRIRQGDKGGYPLIAAIPDACWEHLEDDQILPLRQGRIAGESGVTAAGCPYEPGGRRRRWLIGHRRRRKDRAARNPL